MVNPDDAVGINTSISGGMIEVEDPAMSSTLISTSTGDQSYSFIQELYNKLEQLYCKY